MPRYLLPCEVKEVSGIQYFWANGTDREDALANHRSGEGGILFQEIEVVHIGDVMDELVEEITEEEFERLGDGSRSGKDNIDERTSSSREAAADEE